MGKLRTISAAIIGFGHLGFILYAMSRTPFGEVSMILILSLSLIVISHPAMLVLDPGGDTSGLSGGK